MAKEKLIGIYSITNKINGKIYIGQSIDIYERWNSHTCSLDSNRHHNKHLQYAWIKYGKENFKFDIVEICSIEKLNEKEIIWIKFHKEKLNAYNMTDGGEGTYGWIPSEECRIKIGEANRKRVISEETKNKISNINHTNIKPILQIDLSGSILNRWDSELEIRNTLKISTGAIRGCCKKEPKRYTYKNCIWIYEEEYGKGFDISYYLKNKLNKRIKQLTLDGELVRIWDKISEASKYLNIKDSHISQVAKGKIKSIGGFKWEYV